MITRSDLDVSKLREALNEVPHMQSVSCDCEKCKRMCDTPCIGTPEEMARIHAAGLGAGLAPTTYAPFLLLGVPPVNLVAPLRLKSGCVFRDKCGHCALHKMGLKPLEGRLTSCKLTPEQSVAIPLHIIAQWH